VKRFTLGYLLPEAFGPGNLAKPISSR
jgi:hypothetical protein